MKRKIAQVAKQLFRKRKHTCVPTYTNRFETLEKLIADDLIGIDFKQKLVVLDSSIHILYMNDDRAYAAFFDTIQAYMNMIRGALGISEFIEPKERINFTVVLKQYEAFNSDTGEFFDPPKETAKTLLVGYCQNREVNYAAYNSEELSE